MTLTFLPMPTSAARAFQAEGPDAYGLPPERRVSDGDGVPCRHCLTFVPAGAAYLVLAYRPFPELQPFAETGPIFLCAEPCAAPQHAAAMPEILSSPTYILRGYGTDDRIVYGTGGVVPTPSIPDRAAELLTRADVAYVHVRSASNNCYHLRIEPALARPRDGSLSCTSSRIGGQHDH